MKLYDRNELRKMYVRPVVHKQKKKSKILFDFRNDIKKLMPIIEQCVDTRKGLAIRDVFKEYDFGKKYSEETVEIYLRYVLHFDDIRVTRELHNNQDYLFFNRGRSIAPKALLGMLDKFDLDGWYFTTNSNGLLSKHMLQRCEYDTYILKGQGDIYFDERLVTDEQAVKLVTYLSGGEGRIRMPDVVRNTPINICIPDNVRVSGLDVNEIGREFRITAGGSDGNANGSTFNLTTIYGKEWSVTEHDLDRIVFDNYIGSALSGWKLALEIARLPETIAIIKRILLSKNYVGKIKGTFVIDEKSKLIVVSNRWGTFHLSLIDGNLHRVITKDGVHEKRYICVNPRECVEGDVISISGVDKQISVAVDRVLSKLDMLLQDKYPDEVTRRQIES